MSIEFRAIKESERKECLALWYTVFPKAGEGFFERYFYGDVEWLPYYTQVAVLDGKLVSAVCTVKRTVACGDFRLTMGGIANVATLPNYRGNGYNIELLRRAIEVMEADAMDFSMLGTGINDYYAKLGFSTLPLPVWEGTIRRQVDDNSPLTPQVWGEPLRLGIDSPLPNLGEGLGVRANPYVFRAGTDNDLPAIREIYNLYNAKIPIAVQRYEAYWREWALALGDLPLKHWTVAVNSLGEIVGYISFDEYHWENNGTKELGLSSCEFGLRETFSDEAKKAITRGLFIEAIANCPDATRLRWINHNDPVVLEVLSEVLTDPQRRESKGKMVRLLHRTNLMQSFTLAWNESWTAAGRPSGTLAFQTPYGITTIDATGQFLRVTAEDDVPNALPQETFFGLLFGLVAPESVTDKPEMQELLAALFPARSFAYWSRDFF